MILYYVTLYYIIYSTNCRQQFLSLLHACKNSS